MYYGTYESLPDNQNTYETAVTHMIDNLESGMFGITATEQLLHPTWSKWYQLTDYEVKHWNDLSDIEEKGVN